VNFEVYVIVIPIGYFILFTLPSGSVKSIVIPHGFTKVLGYSLWLMSIHTCIIYYI